MAAVVFSISRLCHNCLRLSQPPTLHSESPSELCAPTNCKMFPNNNFPVSLQVSKQSQPSVTNNNHPDQIFKTQNQNITKFQISPAPANLRMLQVIHDWILLLIAIHLCNLFPWLLLDSPHFPSDSPPHSPMCLWCPSVHWTISHHPLPYSPQVSIWHACSSAKSLEVSR